jgi:hypothetical protein
MTTLSLLDRQRDRTRDRPRPSVPGNFVTSIFYSSLYSLTFIPHPQSYIKWWPYVFPETKALGYFDNPVTQPVWVAIGPVSKPNAVYNIADGIIPGITSGIEIPTPVQQNPVTIVTPDLPGLGDEINTKQVNVPQSPLFSILPDAQLTTKTALAAGDAFTLTVGAVPQQIQNTTFPIRSILIVADDENAGDIWIGYKPTVSVGNGQKLLAGAGVGLSIDDLSSIYLIASSAGDKVNVNYER